MRFWMCFWRFFRHSVFSSWLAGDIIRRNLKRAARALLWPRNILPSSLITIVSAFGKPYVIVFRNCSSAKSSLAQPVLNVSKSDTLIGLSLRQPGNISSMFLEMSSWWGVIMRSLLAWEAKSQRKRAMLEELTRFLMKFFRTLVALKRKKLPSQKKRYTSHT